MGLNVYKYHSIQLGNLGLVLFPTLTANIRITTPHHRPKYTSIFPSSATKIRHSNKF